MEAKKILGKIIISSMLFGAGAGGLSMFFIQEAIKKRQKKIKPGVYLNGGLTYTTLIAIGMHALKDNLYDTYELDEILKEVY